MSILIIEHSELTGSDRLGKRLLEDGHHLQVVRVHRGESLPANLDEIDGVITCGGPQSPDCTDPWVEQELQLLRIADELELPLFGFCLGCQLIARALGGEVSLCDTPEIGWYEIQLSPLGRDNVLLAGQPWTGKQFQWHHWQVSTLPQGAMILAGSDLCKVQAWTKGVNTYAVQFHPECTKETIASWIADDTEQLTQENICAESINADTELYFEDYERLTNRLFDSISQLLMPLHTRLARQRH